MNRSDLEMVQPIMNVAKAWRALAHREARALCSELLKLQKTTQSATAISGSDVTQLCDAFDKLAVEALDGGAAGARPDPAEAHG